MLVEKKSITSSCLNGKKFAIMEKVLTKELVQELKGLKGEARGMNLKNDADFILEKKGKQGLEQIEAELRKMGYPFDYSQIRAYEFYPIGMRAASLLAAKQVFGWKNEDIKEMCGFATYITLIGRIGLRLFHSVDDVAIHAPKLWKEYFSQGELNIPDYDLEKKYALIQVKGFDGHPVFCSCMAGYFEKLGKVITKTEKAVAKETKCQYQGDDYDEFLVEWQ